MDRDLIKWLKLSIWGLESNKYSAEIKIVPTEVAEAAFGRAVEHAKEAWGLDERGIHSAVNQAYRELEAESHIQFTMNLKTGQVQFTRHWEEFSYSVEFSTIPKPFKVKINSGPLGPVVLNGSETLWHNLKLRRFNS